MVSKSVLREVLGCSVTFQEYVHFLLSSWYLTFLPLIVLVALFFVIKKFVDNKKILIYYTVISIIAYVLWMIKIYPVCVL